MLIKPFSNDEFFIRTVSTGFTGNWFVHNDLCAALGITNPSSALESLDSDEKSQAVVSTGGGKQTLSVVNESGMYALIMRSRKDAAKRFRKWVTAVVLPSIRSTGAYKRVGETPVIDDRDFNINVRCGSVDISLVVKHADPDEPVATTEGRLVRKPRELAPLSPEETEKILAERKRPPVRLAEMVPHFNEPTKVCKRCNVAMPVSLFAADKQKKDGLRSYCSACSADMHRLWRAKVKKEKPPKAAAATDMAHIIREAAENARC